MNCNRQPDEACSNHQFANRSCSDITVMEVVRITDMASTAILPAARVVIFSMGASPQTPGIYRSVVKGKLRQRTPLALSQRHPPNLPSTSTRRSGCFPALPYPPVEYSHHRLRFGALLVYGHVLRELVRVFDHALHELLSACLRAYHVALRSLSRCEDDDRCNDSRILRLHAWHPQGLVVSWDVCIRS